MRLLLDTHTFLWFILDDSRLSVRAKSLLETPEYKLLLSPASYWEIAIKIKLGKYSLPQPYLSFMESQLSQNGIVIQPIELRHTDLLTTLPLHHKDPFDRLLVSQAIVENIPIISSDEAIDAYGVIRWW